MKRFYLLLSALLILFSSFAQGYQIKINTRDYLPDSISIRSYNYEKPQFSTIKILPFERTVIFKDKNSLIPGFYAVAVDTVEVASFFISDSRNQKFTINISNDEVSFENSTENGLYMDYMKALPAFEKRFNEIDSEIQQIQQSGVPRYMQQTMFDSILMRIRALSLEKMNYQKQMMRENESFLFASYIPLTFDFPEPPAECMQNRELYNIFIADTILAFFPWQDERIFNTPFVLPLFRNFAGIVYYIPQKQAVDAILNNLAKSRAQNQNSYYHFFDFLEKEFGKLTSPYRDENYYIPMLKFALEDASLDVARKERYTYELNLIDKNNEGDTMPDFPLLMSNGDTTSLYAIEAQNMLVYFQNPECPTCMEVRGKLAQNEVLKQAIANKDIVVITVFFEQDEDLWRNYLKNSADPTYLHGWNFSQEIETQSLYDTRVIPLMMLIDKDKKIIKKDILWNDIESYVSRMMK